MVSVVNSNSLDCYLSKKALVRHTEGTINCTVDLVGNFIFHFYYFLEMAIRFYGSASAVLTI